ncbi:glycosyltransferase family 4 protein [Siphonobacter sp. SORGH_AS_1065]|uniref:glycosyltransferase family 4 protein n=1 Tax=Siphonobacter sp. SORGH_AS_1065 TaxID=3041795 RepID=UPI002786AFDC|nr:glycosyltransferase family 4 protein [Siphonobacter sp. SORGH_AS_1065]MDQ1085605.1 glycosyltransferase involved in cell wall biosynthesis [Siphonobacter sp. SORGH_AS_1065]
MRSVILFHLSGNANVKAAATGLLQANLLAELDVSLACFPGSFLDRLASIPALSEIRRRQFPSSLQPVTHMHPWRELGRLFATKFSLHSLLAPRQIFAIEQVVQHIDHSVARRLKKLSQEGVRAVYGFEDTTMWTFRQAQKYQLKCLYDLPIGYWRVGQRLMETESERWPEWAQTMPSLTSTTFQLQKKDEELWMADHIFVASSFTAQTLQSFPGKLAPVHVVPYGFPPAFEQRTYENKRKGDKLKLLFVGSLTQRKGLANLLAAVDALKSQVELTLVGQKTTLHCKPLNQALAQHRWFPSLANDQILKLMREHDVLVFPSLFEGFGLVITEAMSQGMPVITTAHTAGPDIIKHGNSGWIIKAGSTEALCAQLESILDQPDQLETVGKQALLMARQRSWEQYGYELASVVEHILRR